MLLCYIYMLIGTPTGEESELGQYLRKWLRIFHRMFSQNFHQTYYPQNLGFPVNYRRISKKKSIPRYITEK
jgi:hypothetical protein